MKISKLKSKLNRVFVIVTGFILTANIATAVVLRDYNEYSSEEVVINDIVGNIFIFVFIISAPMFIVGVIRDLKSKKKDKNFSMILFLGVFFAYFSLAFFVLMTFAVFFMKHIYSCYPYFAYVVTGVFLLFVCVFAKISAKVLKSDFLIVLSLFLLITSMFIAKLI